MHIQFIQRHASSILMIRGAYLHSPSSKVCAVKNVSEIPISWPAKKSEINISIFMALEQWKIWWATLRFWSTWLFRNPQWQPGWWMLRLLWDESINIALMTAHYSAKSSSLGYFQAWRWHILWLFQVRMSNSDALPLYLLVCPWVFWRCLTPCRKRAYTTYTGLFYDL